ncbi:MAG TPA: efflux RND transporter periplasmic adaptor subunit, partial [Phycisphaerae bacterium]|nr:efflux RND transporter periplasmic adaptor subunit [Phycisphaerae bacterium]
MKILITVVVTVAAMLILGGGLAMWSVVRKGAAKQVGTKVRTACPERGELVEVVSAPGTVQPKTKVSISARLSARVKELPFEEGDTVTKGDPDADPPVPPSVLVRLDASEMEASLRSAKARRDAQAAQIRVAKANIDAQESRLTGLRSSLAEAKRDLERQQELADAGDVSRSVFDRARTRVDEEVSQLQAAEHALKSQQLGLDVMEFQVAAADAEISQATEQLSYTTITSPIDGTVTQLRAEVGELVMTGTMNNPGTMIVEVADLSRMLVAAVVDEGDIGAVQPGQRVTVRMRAYPDEEFAGAVESVSLVGTGSAATAKEFLVEILLAPTEERIYVGLSADVEIQTRRHEGALKIPSQAVLGRKVADLPAQIRDGNENVDSRKSIATVVYRVVDGKAVVTPVTVGASDATHTIVKSGLDE